MNITKRLTFFSISDLHVEFYPTAQAFIEKIKHKLPEADILILPGDVAAPGPNLRSILSFFKSKYNHVIYVLGNHEYYQSRPVGNRQAEFEKIRVVCEELDICLLEKSSVVIGQHEFLGTTLWSAIDQPTTKAMWDFSDAFTDQFDYLGEFIDSCRWLKHALAQPLPPNAESRIVITHHLPSFLLVHARYYDNKHNSGFASHLLPTLNLRYVSWWLCGHSHEFNFKIHGSTKLLLNPVGYPDEHRSTSTSFRAMEFGETFSEEPPGGSSPSPEDMEEAAAFFDAL